MIFLAGPGHGAPGRPGPGLSGRHLLRGLSRKERGRRGPARVLQAVLVSRRHRQPLHARNARLDPRRRRTRLRALARLRRGFRQPRPDRRGGGRRRRIGNRSAGHLLAHQQVPQPRFAMARCCRSCTSTATRSTIPRCWRASATRSWRACCAATAGRRTSWKAPTPRRMHQAMAATIEHCVDEIRSDRNRKPRDSGVAARPRWPMIVLRSPKGWTAPREVDGHQLEGFWRAHQVPLADVKKNPEQLAHARKLDALATSPRSCSTPTARWSPELKALAPTRNAPHERQPARQRRTPEEGPASARLPRLRAQGRASRGQCEAENTRPLGAFLRDVMKRNMTQLPRLRPGRDHLQQARRHLRSQQEILDRGVLPRRRRRRRTGRRRPRHRDAQRAHHGGHARRLPAHRPARLLLVLRSLRARDRLHVQPARQVAVDLQPPLVAARTSPR